MVGDILQPTHLLFVLVVALLVLGPKRLPEVGRTLGNGIRDFRSAINGESNDSRDEIESKPWHSDPGPEQKHEFAHTSETTPESHEFAHEAPAVSPAAVPAEPQTVPAAGGHCSACGHTARRGAADSPQRRAIPQQRRTSTSSRTSHPRPRRTPPASYLTAGALDPSQRCDGAVRRTSVRRSTVAG